jgi:hypothetical protein
VLGCAVSHSVLITQDLLTTRRVTPKEQFERKVKALL